MTAAYDNYENGKTVLSYKMLHSWPLSLPEVLKYMCKTTFNQRFRQMRSITCHVLHNFIVLKGIFEELQEWYSLNVVTVNEATK